MELIYDEFTITYRALLALVKELSDEWLAAIYAKDTDLALKLKHELDTARSALRKLR